MSGKTIKESHIDDWDPNLPKGNDLLKTDEETVTGALKDGPVVSDDLTSIYHAKAISKILRNSVYGLTAFPDKAMTSASSIASAKPEVGSVLGEVEAKVEQLLVDIELLKARVDELEQENKLLRSRADKVDAENEELRRKDEVLERHISELKLKFIL